jgi:hypothetical protein
MIKVNGASRERISPARRASLFFSSPSGQKLADLALTLVLLPTFFAVLVLLLLIPAGLCHKLLDLDDSAWSVTLPLVVALAVVLGAFFIARRAGWTIWLEEGHARMGFRQFGPRILYPEVQFLKVGDLATLAGPVPPRPRSSPLAIHLPWLRRYRLWLDRADVEGCFEALRQRCQNAAGVNLLLDEPQDYLPAKAAATLKATRRLRRYWATAGVAGLALAMASFNARLAWLAIRRTWHHHQALKRRRS